jgi:hypothetical protein
MRETFGVLVVETRRETIENGDGREVLTGNHLQTLALAFLLFPDKLKQNRKFRSRLKKQY